MPPIGNNIYSTLTSGITDSATTIFVASTADFPDPTGVDGYYYASIWDASYTSALSDPDYEIVRVVDIPNPGEITVDQRGADGTIAKAHSGAGTYAIGILMNKANIFGDDMLKVRVRNDNQKGVWVHALEIGPDGFGVLCNEDINIWGTSNEVQLFVKGFNNQTSTIMGINRVKDSVSQQISSWRPDGGGYLRQLFDKTSSGPGVGQWIVVHGNPTHTNTVTAAGASAGSPWSVFSINTIGTVAAANASVTQATAATFSIAGAPVAGTNVTITNAYALWVQAGRARFGGGVSSTDLAVGRTSLHSGMHFEVEDGIPNVMISGTTSASAYRIQLTSGGDLICARTTDYTTFPQSYWRCAANTGNTTFGGGIVVAAQIDAERYISFVSLQGSEPVAGSRPQLYLRKPATKFELVVQWPSGVKEVIFTES